MSAVRLISRLRRLGVKLHADGERLRFEAPPGVMTDELRAAVRDRKAEILRLLRDAATTGNRKAPPIEPGRRDGDLPVSFAQRRLWFLDQLGAGAAYNVGYAVRLRGALDDDALQRSLDEIVRRHEILRTSFPATAGQPLQRIEPAETVPLTRTDVSHLAPPDREAAARRRVDAERSTPFDLARGPLIRGNLIRLAADDHVLVLMMHHIVIDGWSVEILKRELAAHYAANVAGTQPALPALGVQYADYARWQNDWLQGDVLRGLIEFWRSQMGSDPPVLALPTDRSRPPVMTYDGAAHEFAIPAELAAAIQTLSRTQGISSAMALLAVFQILLARYAGQDDVVVGSPIANRNRSEIENLIGFFVNNLVLRTDLSGNPTFIELLERVRRVSLAAYDHQDLPFEQLVKALSADRNVSTNPVFQITFAMQNTPSEDLALPGLRVEAFDYGAVWTHFDLELHVFEGSDGLVGKLVYNTDLFDHSTIERMAAHYCRLLEEAVSNPNRPIDTLTILDAAERRELVDTRNRTEAPYADGLTVPELVHRTAARCPDAVAVVFEGTRLTYRQLGQQADRLARHLIGLGVGRGDRVGLCVDRSPSMLVGLLGIQMAGAAYVPLDPGLPEGRLRFMLEDADVATIVTTTSVRKRVAILGSHATRLAMPLVRLDADLAETVETGAVPVVHAGPDDLAYIIYTSGSTGRPKGVEVLHRGVVNFLESMQREPGFDANDVLLAVTTLSFDIAVLELLLPLVAGGTVVIASEEGVSDGAFLGRLLDEHEVTVMQATPATWQLLLQAGWSGRPGLRMLCGGEALPRTLADALLGQGGELWNMYGPTETTIWSATMPVDRDPDAGSGVVSIGRPIANTQLYVLDANARLVPDGAIGELCISGDGVARGYWRRPELTAAHFLPDPFREGAPSRIYRTGDLVRYDGAGRLQFLGRVDHQVKLRGFRIELGEIETALREHPDLREAIVLCREDEPGQKRLVAYVVAEAAPPSIGALRDHLRAALPEYMVPAWFVSLESLPLTPNGKVDRRALPRPSGERQSDAAYIAPRSDVEVRIAAVWRDVLGVDRVGVHDSFFELGGDSLLLAQVQARLAERLPREVSLIELFQYPTIASLGRFLHDDASTRTGFLQAARERRAEDAADRATAPNAVAIIGMAGRFPGAANLEQFWENLRDGVETIARFDESELLTAGVDEQTFRDSAYVPVKGFLDQSDCFDAGFFGYSPRDAEIIDPQQRVLLECAQSVLESAGYDPGKYGGRIGIFAGAGVNTYGRGLRNNPAFMASVDPLRLVHGNESDFVTTRIAYKLNLRGPAVNIQTACSTSLVAVHEACKSLRAGECSIALAGGVRVSVPLKSGYWHLPGGILSRDGHCRTFDAEASGTVGGDGVGLVALKRLADAVADGDRIHAVILGSAVNNDGALKVGFTAPSVEGQAEAIAGALCAADVDPTTIGYVEAHGTATGLGDPIEVAALSQVFAEATDRRQYCALGALKSNIGHLDAAAGVGGLMKATLALQHGAIPPSLHYRVSNPQIDFEQSPFFVNTVLRDWAPRDHPRRAGVSSLGIGGTNAHVVLEAAPAAVPSAPARPWQVLTLSARTPGALDRATDDLLAHLERHPETNLADAAFTLQVGRKDFEHRRTLVVEDVADATRALRERDPLRVIDAVHDGGERPVVFMFPGQGAQHPGMGRGLHETHPVFRTEVDRCCAALDEPLRSDLRSVLFPGAGDAEDAARRLADTALTQPALFVVEHALARQWMAWGIEPSAMIGHSVGEFVAACLAGVMSPEDAVTLVAERGRLMATMPRGSMLAVPMTPDELRKSLTGDVAIATINGPELCVVSGPDADVTAVETALRERGVEPQRLHTSHAFHSSMMEPIVEPFRTLVERVPLSAPKRPYVSNVTGTWITAAEATDPSYYAAHLRHAVRFSEGLETLFAAPERVLLEVGPGHTLGSLARRHAGRPATQAVVSSLRHPKADVRDEATIGAALGRLWLVGARPRWRDVHAGERRCRVGLPTYPFERRRYWVEGLASAEPTTTAKRKAGAKNWIYTPSWQRTGAPVASAGGHVLLFAEPVHGDEVAASLRRRGCKVTCVTVGERYERTNDEHVAIDPADGAHYERLLAELDAEGARPERLGHMWSLVADDMSADRALDLGLYSVARLMQALESGGAEASGELTIVTRHAHEVIGTETLCPRQAASLGPAKVIPLEFPGVRCRSIDLDQTDDALERERRAEDLAVELLAPPSDAAVAYRGRHRWVQRFVPANGPAETTTRMRERGVYLITGGLGGVGLVIAVWLAKAYRARLVLLGRSPLPPRETWTQWLAEHDEQDATRIRIEHIRSLESHGAEVMTCCADATDEAAMRNALTDAESRFGPVNGVFHAAGETDVRTPMRGFDRAAFERVFQAKRRGVLTLDRVLAGRSLDFCVVHSSLAAVMGALEMGAYTAAHLYMDAFVWERRRTSAVPWMTVNWDAWHTWRNASTPARPGLAEYIMNAEDAAAALELVFAQGDTSQLLVSTGDLESRIEQWRHVNRAVDDAAELDAIVLHPRAASLRSEFEPPRTEAERTLADIWQRLLGVEPIGINDNFFELGGDSVLNLQIVAKAKQSGLTITPKAVFEHQTIAALAELVTSAAETTEASGTQGDGTGGHETAGSEASDDAPERFSAPALSQDDLAAITRQLGRGRNDG